MHSLVVFLHVTKIADFRSKSAELKARFTSFIYFFGSILTKVYSYAKSHYCNMCVTDFREGVTFLPPSHPPSLSLPQLVEQKEPTGFKCLGINSREIT